MSHSRFSFQNAPIRIKLTVLSMAATMLALFIAYMFSAVGRVAMEWSNHEEELKIKAEIIGLNSATALKGGDAFLLTQSLATLAIDKSIRMAAIYYPDGRLAASYQRQGEPQRRVPPPRAQGWYFEGFEVNYFRDFSAAGGVRIGTIYIQDDLKDFYHLMRGHILATLSAVFAAVGAAYLFWSWAQRMITGPIARLAGAMRGVSKTRDYSVRMDSGAEDEMGTLIAWFNEMLEQIEERDRKLEKRSHYLEEEVTLRTAQLREKNEALRTELAERLRIEGALNRERELFIHGPAVAFKLRAGPGWPVEYITPNVSHFGIEKSPAQGPARNFMDMIHPDDRERFSADAARCQAGSAASFEGEYRLISGREGTYWVDITAIFVWSVRGEVTHMDGYILDVTERKLNEVALQEARLAAETAAVDLKTTLLISEDLRAETEKAKDLAERMALEAARASDAKSDFMANMSHELRTPLNGVIGLTEVLLKSGVSAAQRKKLDMIRFSGNVLLNLVNDILDLSRIEAGKMTLASAEFSPRQVVEDTVGQYVLSSGEKGLELVTDIAENVPPRLVGDPVRLNQVIANLVGNAIKFTHHGEVTVSAGVTETSRESVMLLFRIKDTGIGVPGDQLEKIFTRFTQGDPSITRKYGGAGLGVTISRQLVEKMGGRIWVESKPGQGSTFFFTVRLEQPFQPEAGAAADPRLAGAAVLIVDDNESSRNALARIAGSMGLAATIRGDWTSALKAMTEAGAQGRQFALAIIDQEMPNMTGVDLARKIKLSRWGAAPKVALLSSVKDEFENPKKLEGVDAIIQKPVRKDEFAAMALRLITGGGGPEGPEAGEETAPKQLMRILLAEDNPVNQEVALSMLQRMGHTVDLAENGALALGKWSPGRYGLVLMDVQMPEMDGLTATRAIRTREEELGAPRTPIIAMTAHAMEGDRAKCLAAGMDDYLAKPISMASLAAKLGAISGRQTQPPAPSARPRVPFSVQMVVDLLGLERESAERLIQKFIDTSRKNIDSLKEAAAANDAELAHRMAHSIKGSSLQIGAAAMGKIAERIETLGRAGILSQTTMDHLAELEAEFERIENGLREQAGE